MRLDPPVDVEDLVIARPAELLDPAVDDLRFVVLEGEGYGLGLLLLLPLLDSLWLLRPVSGASGVIRCSLDGNTHRRAGDSLG